MITLSLHGKPLAAWLVPKTPPARRARFVRHHLHHLTVESLSVFTDDAKTVGNGCKLLELPIGEYELHVGEGRLVKLVVTALEINVDGVLVIETPDRGYHYMPTLHLGAMTELGLLDRPDMVAWAYVYELIAWRSPTTGDMNSQEIKLPPLGATLDDRHVQYRLIAKGISPPARLNLPQGWARLLGKIEVGTGRITPMEELLDEDNDHKIAEVFDKLTQELG
jgi:hypothetical protein